MLSFRKFLLSFETRLLGSLLSPYPSSCQSTGVLRDSIVSPHQLLLQSIHVSGSSALRFFSAVRKLLSNSTAATATLTGEETRRILTASVDGV